MARVVRFHEIGDPEVLKIEELDVPPPGKGEVQIRIHALGLNRAESMFRKGQYLEEPKLPARLGYEAAGTVAAIGEGVEGFRVGDAVSTIPAFSLNTYGLYGELANAPAHAVTHHPASLSWSEAAAVWMQYLTAYGALIDLAGLKSGDALAIPAASSSVGLAAIQIANRVGATPIALTRGSSKRQALLDAGAAHVIATDEQDLVKEILAITNGKGARVVFDPVGGPTVEKFVKATARPGTLFLYGALITDPTPLPLFDVLGKWVTIRGYVMMEITSDPERLEREGVHKRRARRGDPPAGHRQNLPARRDYRGPPRPGVEPAGRQGRRDGVTATRSGGITRESRPRLKRRFLCGSWH
jgi:NADPH:quinone reductase-like Zn-dependent oxidoreductase